MFGDGTAYLIIYTLKNLPKILTLTMQGPHDLIPMAHLTFANHFYGIYFEVYASYLNVILIIVMLFSVLAFML